MIIKQKDLEIRILRRVLTWDSKKDGAPLTLNWEEAPEFFGMALLGANGVEACWDRLYDVLADMVSQGLLEGDILVNRIEGLKLAYPGAALLHADEAAALEAERELLAAEKQMLLAAQKAAHADKDSILEGRREIAKGQKALTELKQRMRVERDTLSADREALDGEIEKHAERMVELEANHALLVKRFKADRIHSDELIAARQIAADAAESSAGKWRAAGLLCLVLGSLAALFALTHSTLA